MAGSVQQVSRDVLLPNPSYFRLHISATLCGAALPRRQHGAV